MPLFNDKEFKPQEDVTINTYVPITRTSKYIKQKLIEQKQ